MSMQPTGTDGNAPERDEEAAERLERLHKFLASTGAGSRRECETFIQQRRVTVNGQVVTKMGVKVDPFTDKVTFDGESVTPEEKVYWILNKPPGTICTNSDERGRPRVVDLVPDQKNRIYTVGRLDADSRGLILLTNDGGIANVICHPRYRIEKVYQVAVRGRVTREQIARVEAGVWLAEGKSSPARVKPLGRNPKRDETVLEMTVFEGRNREVRRVLARVGLNVRRLLRTSIGPVGLGKLPPGGSRRLDPDELSFVADAEKLYLANQEAWDAELPPEKPARGPRRPQGGGNRPPRSPGAHDPSKGRAPSKGAPARGGRAPGRGRGPGREAPDTPATDVGTRRSRRFYR